MVERFSSLDIKKIVKSLAQKGVVELLDNHIVKSSVTKRQFDIYSYREAHGFNSDGAERVRVSAPPPKRNPFDFDTPSNPFDFETRTETKDSEDIDDWLADDATNDPLFVDLKEHLSEINISELLKKIAHITIVPEFLSDALRYLALTEEKQKETQVAFPNNPILCSTKNKPMCSFLIVVGSHLLFNEICVTHETTHEILDCAKIMD